MSWLFASCFTAGQDAGVWCLKDARDGWWSSMIIAINIYRIKSSWIMMEILSYYCNPPCTSWSYFFTWLMIFFCLVLTISYQPLPALDYRGAACRTISMWADSATKDGFSASDGWVFSGGGCQLKRFSYTEMNWIVLKKNGKWDIFSIFFSIWRKMSILYQDS